VPLVSRPNRIGYDGSFQAYVNLYDRMAITIAQDPSVRITGEASSNTYTGGGAACSPGEQKHSQQAYLLCRASGCQGFGLLDCPGRAMAGSPACRPLGVKPVFNGPEHPRPGQESARRYCCGTRGHATQERCWRSCFHECALGSAPF